MTIKRQATIGTVIGFIILIGLFFGFDDYLRHPFGAESTPTESIKVISIDILHTLNREIEIKNTDENENETFIIKSDKSDYSGLSGNDVYFSITNLREDENGYIKFKFLDDTKVDWIKRYSIEEKTIEKSIYEEREIKCEESTSSTSTIESYCVENVKTGTTTEKYEVDKWINIEESENIIDEQLEKFSKNSIARKSYYTELNKGTTFFKAHISYKIKTYSEFFIEVIGDKDGYGLLDPNFGSDWNRKCAVTIDNTKVSGAANLTDFPVLLTEDNLPSEMFDADGSYPARSDGGDIRFSSDIDGDTELAREVVEFTINNDPASGTAQIWVKVPTLDHDDDTIIYVWYNAPSETEPARDATYGMEAVWDSGYTFVHHLEESSGNAIDSTENTNDGTYDGNLPDNIAGKISDGQDMDGSGDYLYTSGYKGVLGQNSWTISCWIKLDANNGALFNWGKNQIGGKIMLDINTDGKIHIDNNGNSMSGNSTDLADGNYHLVHATFSGTTRIAGINFYKDGSGETETRADNYNLNLVTDKDVYLGYNIMGDINPLNGIMDEARMYAGELSSDWIATEYANQNAPADFSEAGTPSDVVPPDTCTAPTDTFWQMDLQDHCTTTVSTYSDYGMECYNPIGGSWVIGANTEVRRGSSTNCLPQIEGTGVFSIQPIH